MTDKHAAAQRIANRLFEAEHALDEALARTAALVAEVSASRAELGVSLKTGASAVAKLALTVSNLAALRQNVAEAHDELAVIQRAVGVRPNMVGGGEKDDDLMPRAVRRVA